MNRQGKAVRPPVPGPDSRNTSGLPPQPRPVQQSGSRGRVRHGNGASDKQREDQDTSSHKYEDADAAKRYPTQREDQDTSSHKYEDVDGVKRYATSAGATPMQQPEPYWRSRADAAAKIPNPMYASNAGSTTVLQPQSKRSRADSAAKMANPIYASGSEFLKHLPVLSDLAPGTKSCSGWSGLSIHLNNLTAASSRLSRSVGRSGTFLLPPREMIFKALLCTLSRESVAVSYYSSLEARGPDPPMDQPQTDNQARANGDVNTYEVTYATIPDDPPMDQPQARANDDENTPNATIPDGAYPGGASGRPGVCSFLRARRSWLAPGIAVLVSLCAMGLAPLTFSNKQEISTIVNAVKLDQDDIRQLSDNVDALKRDQDNISTTVDAWKRDLEVLRQLSTTVDALKREQNALKHDLEYERNRTATLEQRLHEIENGAHTNSSATGGDDTPMDQPQARENDDENTPNATIPGYTRRRGICYKAFNTRKTFSEAAVACRADGGTLAMPRDAETEAFLVSLYKPVRVCDNRGFWIGLHDQREEGRFEWLDGSALGPYSSWRPGQPNNGKSKGDRRECHHDCTAALLSSAVKLTLL
ncbi:hypothetical protein Bbelb_083160 [Branchiostoma belcheri]|nr:hypothetical protein Bbelb_083160 [Branchiostoma belcheri]